MKKLLFSLTIMIFAVAYLTGCKQDPSSSANNLMPMTQPPPSAAHPAIAYHGIVNVTSGHTITSYDAISVMDTDGTHQTNLVTASSNNNSQFLRDPSWNYSGTSMTYRDYTSGNYPSYIKAVDVTVNSSGVPVGSNQRTIYSLALSDSAWIKSGPVWSATSATGKIAFTRQHIGSQNGLAELCTISQSGGTVTVLASYKHFNTQGAVMSQYVNPTWSPDDSKIAVFRMDTIGKTSIMIFDASTGAALDSIPLATGIVRALEWSRTGANLLVFEQAATSSSPVYIYYTAPTTGSTPTTNSVVGQFATWSPNNSSLIYVNVASSNALTKVTAQTSSTTQLTTAGPTGTAINWKR